MKMLRCSYSVPPCLTYVQWLQLLRPTRFIMRREASGTCWSKRSLSCHKRQGQCPDCHHTSQVHPTWSKHRGVPKHSSLKWHIDREHGAGGCAPGKDPAKPSPRGITVILTDRAGTRNLDGEPEQATRVCTLALTCSSSLASTKQLSCELNFLKVHAIT